MATRPVSKLLLLSLVTVYRSEIRLIQWMCGVRFMCNELKERLRLDDIMTVMQQNIILSQPVFLHFCNHIICSYL